MKAILWTAYGPPDVLELRDVEKPAAGDNEVLVRIHAGTVTAGDSEMRALKLPPLFALPLRLYFGFGKPERVRILGQELAGEIEAVGKEVKSFKPGDPIFASTGFRFGANAEYVCLSQDAVMAIKPTNMTYEQAAAVPVAGLEALYFLRQAHIRTGEKVLIIGAGGSIGTFAVQLAKHYGAHVTAVDRGGKLDMLRSIGADRVVDYTQEEYLRTGSATGGGDTYDVIFDVMGVSSFSRSIQSLNENGRFLAGNAGLFRMLRGAWTSLTSSRQVIVGSAMQTSQDLLYLKLLIESGNLQSVIDRRYPLEQTADAHRYVESGEKKGNVVIFVG